MYTLYVALKLNVTTDIYTRCLRLWGANITKNSFMIKDFLNQDIIWVKRL